MAERVECARCGGEERRVEMEQTSEGMLCEECLRKYVREDAGSLGVSFGTALRWIGWVAFLLAVVFGAWAGPQWYWDEAREAFNRCIYVDTLTREREPKACVAVFDGTGWLRHVPWMSRQYRDDRTGDEGEAYQDQLRWVSAIEPSARERTVVLQELDDLHEQGNVQFWIDSPARYLSGIGSSIADKRTSFADAFLRGFDGGVVYAEATDLVRYTNDRALRSWLIDAALAGNGDIDWLDVEYLYDVAAMACRAGREEDALELLRRYERIVRESGPDWRPGWDDASDRKKKNWRETFTEKADEKSRRADLFRSVCGETERSTWWTEPEARSRVARSVDMSATDVRISVVASLVAREGQTERAELARIVAEDYGEGSVDLPKSTPLRALASRSESRFQWQTRPRALLRHRMLVPPGTFRRAARRLEEAYELAELKWARSLTRALRLQAAIGAARLGDREMALGIVEDVEVEHVALRMSFEAAVHRLSGSPRRAAELLARVAEAERPEEGKESTLVRQRQLRRVAALGAAREFGGARRLLSEIDAGIEPGPDGNTEIVDGAYPGWGFALALMGDAPVDATLEEVLSEDVQPNRIVSFRPKHMRDGFRYLYRLRTSKGPVVRVLREDPERTLAEKVWYQVAVGAGVERSSATEVWLDFVTGRQLRGSPASGAWSRAEAARWRGDDQAAERWMARVFPEAEQVDEPQELLLSALVGRLP